jgi:ribosome biogenesis GTPase A
VTDNIELLDSPGVLPPSLRDQVRLVFHTAAIPIPLGQLGVAACSSVRLTTA